MSSKKYSNPQLTATATALCATVNNLSLVSRLSGISQSTLRYRSQRFKKWLIKAILQANTLEDNENVTADQEDEFIEIQILNLDTQRRILQSLERGESFGELAPKDAANVLKILHELSLSYKSNLLNIEKKSVVKSNRSEQFDTWSKVWKEITKPVS